MRVAANCSIVDCSSVAIEFRALHTSMRYMTRGLLAVILELVVNMKTADALGIAIPQSILIRADELVR